MHSLKDNQEDLQESQGDTALMKASVYGSTDVVLFLLHAGQYTLEHNYMYIISISFSFQATVFNRILLVLALSPVVFGLLVEF